ncbi:MAG: restriction endonuclease subunit S [Nitrosopumilus sp.]|nr:restriction endonuclease subunit S [Nitrosopumilus sp.]
MNREVFLEKGDTKNPKITCRIIAKYQIDVLVSMSTKYSKDDVTNLTSNEIKSKIQREGILTFDACFPDSVVGFTSNEYTNTEYIQHWLSFLQKTLENNAPESAQKNINLTILENLNVPIPPIALQNEFSNIVKSVNEMSQHQEHSKKNIENISNTFMQKAFKGELVC